MSAGQSGHPDDNGLRAVIEEAKAETGLGLGALTIMAPSRDPYRLDTPANQRDGAWLAEHAQRHEDDDPGSTIHLRGLHYKIMSSEALKPNSEPYRNTDRDWEWLNHAAKVARWLGYVPFDRIHDARNAEPVVRIWTPPDPTPYLNVGVHIEIPDVVEPTIIVADFVGTQPYRIVLFGEKTSLEPVVAPIAERYRADLYLPSGDISDTLLHRIAKTGAEDGRRAVVLTLSDCDPPGWNMPKTIAHKLRAFRDSLYPGLSFEVRRVALVPSQVRAHSLPVSPLKESDQRAEINREWREATGLEQTEIDALASLNPNLLRRIITDAIKPFYDASLDWRVAEAKREWLKEAQAALVEQLDSQELERITGEAEAKLAELRAEIDAINEAMQIDVGADSLPEIVVPEPEIDQPDGTPLTSSEWSFAQHHERLMVAKAYRGDDS